MKLKVSRQKREREAPYPGWGCPTSSRVIAIEPSHQKLQIPLGKRESGEIVMLLVFTVMALGLIFGCWRQSSRVSEFDGTRMADLKAWDDCVGACMDQSDRRDYALSK